MINSNAPYSGLSNIMNMRDRNPNTQLAYVPNSYLNSVPTAPNPYTGIPQVNSPIAMNEGGMPSMQYPMQEEAGQLADRGRYGDTTLVHMTPGEVQGLASLGQLTINPDTGLPEAFNMQALLPIIGGIAGSFLLPGAGTALGAGLGASAVGAGLGTAAGGLLAGQKPGDALLNGVLSGAMSFGIGSAFGGAGITPTAATGAEITTTAGGLDPTAAAMMAGQGPTGVATVGQVMDPTAAAMNVGYFGTPETQLISKTVPTFEGYSVPAREPDLIQRTLGVEAEPAKVISKSDLMGEVASRKLTDPLTYAPLAMGAATGAFDDPYEYEEPPPRPPVDTGYGDYTLAGGTPRKSKTQEELLAMALGGGREKMFEDSYYVRNAAEGGIVGLQQGGMATPQAPSAMSAMLAPPMQQQPMPMQQQPMPMQQQPINSNNLCSNNQCLCKVCLCRVFNLFPINL
jgi:hypothetical protein